MHGANGRRLTTLFLALGLILPAGCRRFDVGPSWLPFQNESDDDIVGVTLPQEKVGRLRSLASNSAYATPQQKQETSVELARSLATEEDLTIRIEIVRALGEFPGAEADLALSKALSDSESDVRVAACEVWGKRGDAEAVQQLSSILSGDIDKDVRLAAARALGHSKSPAAIAALGTMLEDKDPAMRYRAVLSLREITGRDFDSDVRRWQEYVKNGSPQPAESTSVAQRFRSIF